MTDFTGTQDVMHLENLIIRKLTPERSTRETSTSAQGWGDVLDCIIDDSTSGTLAFDADGTGKQPRNIAAEPEPPKLKALACKREEALARAWPQRLLVTGEGYIGCSSTARPQLLAITKPLLVSEN